MNLSTQGVSDPHELGSNSPNPGRYHVLVKAVDEANPKFPDKLVVEFEVLHGTVPAQKGKTHREWFSTKPEHLDRLKRLAMVLGLIGPNQQKNVAFAEGIGRQCIIEIDRRENEGKVYIQIPLYRGGIWAIGHADVKDVPLDQTMLTVHGQDARVASPGGPAPQAAAGAVQSAAQPQAVGAGAPVAAGDLWANV